MTAANSASFRTDRAADGARVDHYALDDTLAGRIAQAAGIGILTALPDYFHRKTSLAAAYALGCAGMVGLIAFANAQREGVGEGANARLDDAVAADIDDAVANHKESSADPAQDATPERTLMSYLFGVFIFAFMALNLWITIGINRAIVRALVKRGIAKPWTALGVAASLLAFVASEAEAREIEKRAS